ncbi:MAG: hypothetical protein AB7K09_06965 [Planctomycetota bacterium]
MQIDLTLALLIGAGALTAGALAGRRLGFRKGYAKGAAETRQAQPASASGTTTRERDQYDDGPQNELWEQLLDTCYHDFRVQAIAGRDRDFFSTLHEPLFVDPQVSMDSPLLPGEITVTDVHDVKAFREVWAGRKLDIYEKSSELDLEERQFIRRLLDDLLENLEKTEAGQQAFRLAVRTPGHQHEVLLSHDLRRVLGVIPGDVSLRGGVV